MVQGVGTGGGAARDLAGLQRVLVVEDDVIALRSLEKTLKLEGFEVHTARTIEDAKKVIEEQELDAALVDLQVNGERATGLVRSLRTAKRPCCAVMITGESRKIAAREAIAAGADDVLVKPIQVDDLFKAIRKTVERTRVWREQLEEAAAPESESPRLSVVAYARPNPSPSSVPTDSKRSKTTTSRTKLMAWPALPTLRALDIERCADAIAEIGGLTERERKILVPLLRGEQNDEIAQTTGASRRTVKFHVSNILGKLRISQRSELVRFLF